MKKREYSPQVLNMGWTIEEYKDGKLQRRHGYFRTKKLCEEVIGLMDQVISDFIQDNDLEK